MPHEPALRHFREVVGGPIALWVGACSADAFDLVAGLHVARTYLGSTARLVCAVVPDDARFARGLQRQAAQLALPTAHVTRPTDDTELAACFTAAAAFFALGGSVWQPVAAAFGVRTMSLTSPLPPSVLAEAIMALV